MNARHIPKIRGGVSPPAWLIDHTDRNMHMHSPRPEVVAEWAAAGLELPDLAAIRRYRLQCVQAELQKAGCDAAMLYDPINIRYATDTTKMSIWTAHNAVRYVFIPADGPVTVFEYSESEFRSAHSEVVGEIRPATSFVPFYVGDRMEEIASRWADELVDLIDEVARSGGRRLAIDTLSLAGSVPSSAVGAASDIQSSPLGEWIETRLLSSGPQTTRGTRRRAARW